MPPRGYGESSADHAGPVGGAAEPPGQSLADGAAVSASAAASLAATVRVEDQLEPRIRLPADLLRCLTACIEIALLTILALIARPTTSAVQEESS